MTSHITDYLDHYYISDVEFMQQHAISENDFRHLLETGVIAAPSYSIQQQRLHSVVFGELASVALPDRRYFHRRLATQMQQRLGTVERHGAELTLVHAEQNFLVSAVAALGKWQLQQWPLTDCQDESGQISASLLQQRALTYWQYFQQGICGLCVSEPDSVAAIVEKELLQERLNQYYQTLLDLRATAKAANLPIPARLPPAAEPIPVLQARYAKACMPFTSVEYPRSSRYRLLELLS